MEAKVLIGTDHNDEKIYLSKHSWDCNWYWGFGYLGNKNCHYHFESYLDGRHTDINEVFKTTKISQAQWWKILELFKQAYNLKYAYETYYRGGAHYTSVKDMGINKDLEMAERIKTDMEKILNDVWEFIRSI